MAAAAVARGTLAQEKERVERFELLFELTTPTLLISGRYDEATPLIVGQIHERIPGSEWALFEESSHMPHVEEPVAFLERVEAFLRTID